MPDEVRPITPDEVAGSKNTVFPAAVFEAFNELITQKFSGGSAVIKQDEVAALIAKKTRVKRQTIFDKGWLNVEEAYRAAGWDVSYDKPGYNESGPATFTFRRHRK